MECLVIISVIVCEQIDCGSTAAAHSFNWYKTIIINTKDKNRKLHILKTFTLFKVSPSSLQSTTPPYSKYPPPSSKYHTVLFKLPHHPLQSITRPLQNTTILFSKYHTTLFKVPQNSLQSTTPPSSKHHPPSSKYPPPSSQYPPPSSKYHITLFKVPLIAPQLLVMSSDSPLPLSQNSNDPLKNYV